MASAGEVVDGRYELEVLIGRGGMGTVWRARHVFTNARVALKLIEVQYDSLAFERFLAEARAASTIGHPAIVAVNDANRTADNQLYLAMELLVGKPLRVAMASGMLSSTADTAEQIRRIGLEVLDALTAAHAHNIIHRDLKPENIFLVAPGHGVKLLDFGIAKVLGGRATFSHPGMLASSGVHTQHSSVLGTIEYMAPEQLANASDVDGRADLWALAIILYEMIAGLRPFGGATVHEKIEALLEADPTPIETIVPVPAAVSAFFQRALARDRTRRFVDAAEMAAALRGLPLTANAVAPSSSAGPTLGTGEAWAARRPPSIPPADGYAATHRATPASIPPPDEHATQQPQPNHNIATGAPVPRAAPRKSRALPLAIVGVVVIAGVVTIGALAGRSSKQTVATIDAGPTPRPTPTPTPTPSTVSDSCRATCSKLADCGLAFTDCHRDCEAKVVNVACVEAASECGPRARCMWNRACGALPASYVGTKSCNDTLKCFQANCAPMAKLDCLCACNLQLRPSSAIIMARLYVCKTNVGDDNDRFVAECSRLARACQSD